MEKIPTIVEFLIKELIFKTEFENLPNQYVLMSDKDIDNIIEQAKAMEKEQKIEFAKKCLHENDCFFDIEQYYNKTFKSE